MSVNTQETIIGISRTKQQDIGVHVDTAAEYWRVSKTNASLASVVINTEDDSADIGKGDEWANNVFLTSKDVSFPLESYITSQKLAHMFAFGFGKTTKSTPETGAHLYTCVPADPITDGIEMPKACFIEQIRPGGSAVLDRMLVDCALNDFGFRLSPGPSRQNATLFQNWQGSGREVRPSGITLPAALAESGLNVGGFGITVNGVNYVTQKNFISCEFAFNNNLDAEGGLFPGSGVSDGAQVRGRQERGNRAVSLRFQARFSAGSTELAAFLAQTEGTVVLTFQGALIAGTTYHGGTITGHRTVLRSAQIVDSSGKVAVDCEVTFKKHSSNGVITAAIVTDQDNIMATAA